MSHSAGFMNGYVFIFDFIVAINIVTVCTNNVISCSAKQEMSKPFLYKIKHVSRSNSPHEMRIREIR